MDFLFISRHILTFHRISFPFTFIVADASMLSSDLPAFQNKLLHWFARHQRDLPWRRSYDPYAVWISEIMLQQTQVTTVLPYFSRWMTTLPTIESVVEASEETILKLWEGLGYYSRAQNIRKAAQRILEEHQGEFPGDFEKILALPGIGRYTAGAIASVAFNQDKPVVDGNVERVICRLMNFRENPKSAAMRKTLWQLAESWIPHGQARFFNQALMELGALICLPQSPACLICPAQAFCQALQAGSPEQVPAKTQRRPLQSITTVLAVIQKEERFLIRKRPSEGLMAGLWEFPNIQLNGKRDMQQTLITGMREQHRVGITIERRLSTIKHGYTSFKVTLHCFLCACEDNEPPGESKSVKWVTLNQLGRFSFPSAHVRLIRILQDPARDA